MCYSWWCLSALAILRRQHWIDEAALTRFILNCQARGRCFAVLLSSTMHRPLFASLPSLPMADGLMKT